MNPQLIEYIKAAIASGQSRENITQALAQNGWKAEDIQQGFAQIAQPAPVYSAPMSAMASGASAHSKLPWILGAVAVVAILAVGGGLVWASQQAKNTATNAGPISATASSSPIDDVSGGNGVADTPADAFVVTVGSSAPAATTQVKSEIDAYGVDLYTLKQGVTTIERTAPKKMEIVYTRTGDEIKREVATIDAAGGKSTATLTISLNAKEYMLTFVKELETKLGNCKDTSSGDCKGFQVGLTFIKENCIALQKNEEISRCLVAATISVWASQTQK